MNILMYGGFTRWMHSESANLRGLYVLSYPLVVAIWLLEAFVLLPIGDALVNTTLAYVYCQMIDQFTDLPSKFAKVSSVSISHTHLFFCIEFFSMPILILVLGIRFYCTENSFIKDVLKNRSWQEITKALLGITVLLPVCILGFLIPGDPSFCSGCTTDSLLGLFLLYGVIAPMSFSWLIAMGVILYGCIISRLFRKI